MANRIDLQKQSDLGQQCLHRPVCPKTYDHYSKCPRFYSSLETYDLMPSLAIFLARYLALASFTSVAVVCLAYLGFGFSSTFSSTLETLVPSSKKSAGKSLSTPVVSAFLLFSSSDLVSSRVFLVLGPDLDLVPESLLSDLDLLFGCLSLELDLSLSFL